MSYTALSTLVCLGDDLSRVDKEGLLQGILRKEEGDIISGIIFLSCLIFFCDALFYSVLLYFV